LGDILQFDPSRRVIAGFFPTAHLACDAARSKAVLQRRAQRQVIDAQPGIAGEGVPEILPKGVDALTRGFRPSRLHQNAPASEATLLQSSRGSDIDSHSSLNITRHVPVPFVAGGRSWRLRALIPS
jgi:hypothetical protein